MPRLCRKTPPVTPAPLGKMNGQSREDTSLKLWQQKGRSIDRNRFHLLSLGTNPQFYR